MKHTLGDQTLALAGIVQAALEVHAVAQGVEPDTDQQKKSAADSMINSIFVTDPEDMWSVFGSPDNLHNGIVATLSFLRKPDPQQLPALKYSLTLLEVEKSLRRNPDCVAELSEGIARIDQQRNELSKQEVISALAKLYKATISRLEPRVKVVGRSEILSQRETAEEVRALLLAGVRAAWLWHQLGGRRWKLLLQRASLRQALEPFLTPPEIH